MNYALSVFQHAAGVRAQAMEGGPSRRSSKGHFDSLVDMLRTILPQLIECPQWLNMILERAEFVAIGMVKIRLVEWNGFTLTFHIFHPKFAATVEGLHSHQWDFLSGVLFGELKSVDYEASDVTCTEREAGGVGQLRQLQLIMATAMCVAKADERRALEASEGVDHDRSPSQRLSGGLTRTEDPQKGGEAAPFMVKEHEMRRPETERISIGSEKTTMWSGRHVLLRKTQEHIYRAGETYFCPTKVIHRVLPPEVPTATLMLAHPPSSKMFDYDEDRVSSDHGVAYKHPTLSSSQSTIVRELLQQESLTLRRTPSSRVAQIAKKWTCHRRSTV